MTDTRRNPLDPAPKQKPSAERPTVGRIVHVALPPSHGEISKTNPLAAIVTGVHEDDGSIDVTIFPRGTHEMTSTFVAHESVAPPGAPSWRWPFRS